MTEQKIYPITPWHETMTIDREPAFVVAYEPRRAYPWHTLERQAGVTCFVPRLHDETSLTSLPDIPPEAREPKPGEVWESVTGLAVYLIKRPSGPGCVWDGWAVDFGDGTIEQSKLVRPWPSDRPHGFEGLIDAILQAHGNKE